MIRKIINTIKIYYLWYQLGDLKVRYDNDELIYNEYLLKFDVILKKIEELKK